MKKIPVILLMFMSIMAFAQEEKASQEAISEELSLEDLMNVQVTSVSKSSEKLQDVAASLYVITQEDIRRSGATRLQDILSSVPGAFFNNNNYVSTEFGMREDANAFLGTVLVLVDNVPYQSPYTSAFDFTNFDMDFDEIDRIEVIKGPGGAIYGANAATGVISIFTKKAKDAQGFKVSTVTGSRGLAVPSIRYGTTIGENTYMSVGVKANFFDGYKPMDEFNGNYVTVPYTGMDGVYVKDSIIKNNLVDNVYRTNKLSATLNLQSKISDKLSLSSNFLFNNHKYDSYFPGTMNNMVLNKNNNNRIVSSLRLDYEATENQSIFIQFSNNVESNNNGNTNIITSQNNLELQDNIKIGTHNLSFGANLKQVNFQIKSSPDVVGVSYKDPNSTENLIGFFAQYKLPVGKKFDAIIGAKAEKWTLISEKFDISPSIRLSYRPITSLTIWAAGSRSLTTPGFIQTNIDLTLVPSYLDSMNVGSDTVPIWYHYMTPRVALVNAPEMHPTEYQTGEFGIKATGKVISVELSGFYSMVDNAIGVASIDPTNPDNWIYSPVDIQKTEKIVPVYYSNIYKSKNMGGELLVKYKPIDMLSLEFSYAHFEQTTEGKSASLQYEDGSVKELIVSYTEPEIPSTPSDIVRLKLNLNFKKDLYVSIENTYSTKAGSNSFIYYMQSAPGIVSPIQGYTLDPVENKYKLDLKVEKRFNSDKNSVYIFGNDITNTGTIENFNSYQTGIPYETHGIYGVGATIKF